MSTLTAGCGATSNGNAFTVADGLDRFEALDLAKTQVVLVTDYGELTLQFRPDKAPRHVESFVKLSLQGFAFSEQGKGAQLGLNANALLGDATVAYAEWAGGKDHDLLSAALSMARAVSWKNGVL